MKARYGSLERPLIVRYGCCHFQCELKMFLLRWREANTLLSVFISEMFETSKQTKSIDEEIFEIFR